MTREIQQRIDAISWYHEFSFPNGMRAIPTTPGLQAHREFWRFSESRLDRLEFTDKTVLDIGCWDGFWRFYAERRGASHVLATDDKSQNWAGSAGLELARELLGSKVETRLDVSIYDLSRLGQFDVILCMGVWYHLVDAFHAFAQVRHRCHANSVVVFEGDILYGEAPYMMRYDLSDPSKPIFLPSLDSLRQMWKAAYFDVVSEASLTETRLASPVGTSEKRGWLPRSMKFKNPSYSAERALLTRRTKPIMSDRLFAVCLPVEVASNPYTPIVHHLGCTLTSVSKRPAGRFLNTWRQASARDGAPS